MILTVLEDLPMVVHLVCGARPNFMKVAPLYHALKREPWARPIIVHTGQHEWNVAVGCSFLSRSAICGS
jgi:UDP-N-acetylglucosamine 2-epimerase